VRKYAWTRRDSRIRLGFVRLYRYRAGKADWAASGRPLERSADAPATAQQIMHREVPACAPADRVATARRSMKDSGVCAVINERRVKLGVIELAALENSAVEGADQERAVE
jgi:hypothetical protein